MTHGATRLARGLVLVVVTAAPAGAQVPRFAEDVAPLLDQHCLACHSDQGVGPFSLVTYDEVRARGPRIAEVVEAGLMPPWLPTGDAGAFANERRLGAAEAGRIRAWVDGGMPEGDAAARPDPTAVPPWPLGPPDLILTAPEAYELAAGEGDVYRNFVVPTGFAGVRWVVAATLDPAVSQGIQAARILVDAAGAARLADEEDPAPGYPGLMVNEAGSPDGHQLLWAPGRTPHRAPDDQAWPLTRDADLVVQLQLLRGDEPIVVQPVVGLYLADRPATIAPVSVLLSSRTIDIPGGDAAHAVEDRFRLPVSVDLLAVAPHAHHLARQVEAQAELPDGRTVPLLRIDEWQLRWQDEYRLATPLRLPAGSLVSMRVVFDNSPSHPRRPPDPPGPVRFGPAATDEMAELVLQVIPTNPAEQMTLRQSVALKAARDAMLGYQARLRSAPDDHETLTALAATYLDIGESDLAVQRLEDAIGLVPDYVPAHYNLGSAHLVRGATEEAMAAYRRAIELQPDHADAHNNLGGLLESVGQTPDAVAHYRLAIRYDARHFNARYNLAHRLQLNGDVDAALVAYEDALSLAPDDPDALNNYGRMLVAMQRYEEAADAFRRVRALQPAAPAPMLDLAWLYATSPHAELLSPREAVALAEQAGTLLGGDHPVVLDTLAAAYAADGQFERAVTTAQAAVEAARTQPGLEQAALDIEGRITFYLAFRPYRMVLPD